MSKPAVVGQSRFKLEPIVCKRLPFIATVPCICCGDLLDVPLGAIAPSFRIGREVVGVCCDACVDAKTRAQLIHLRRKKALGATQ